MQWSLFCNSNNYGRGDHFEMIKLHQNFAMGVETWVVCQFLHWSGILWILLFLSKTFFCQIAYYHICILHSAHVKCGWPVGLCRNFASSKPNGSILGKSKLFFFKFRLFVRSISLQHFINSWLSLKKCFLMQNSQVPLYISHNDLRNATIRHRQKI